MPNPFALPEGMALFTFHGRVVRGKRLGSRLGFPTANITYDPRSRTWPREGVYVGVAQLDGTPAEVFSQVQKVKALGLDVPPMAELAMRLRAGGLSLPDGILTVADMVKELKKALCPSK